MKKIRKLIKKEIPSQLLSCEFLKTFKNTFFIEQLWRTAFATHTYFNRWDMLKNILRLSHVHFQFKS